MFGSHKSPSRPTYPTNPYNPSPYAPPSFYNYVGKKDDSSKPDEESSKPNEETSKPDEESSKPDEESSKPDEESSKADEESSKADEETSPPDDNSTPDEGGDSSTPDNGADSETEPATPLPFQTLGNEGNLLYKAANPTRDLKSSVVVAVTGEYAPTQYYDFLKFGDQFAEKEGSKDLTEKGAESMFALGRSIQKLADESL